GDDLAVVWVDYVFDPHVHALPAARLGREAYAEQGDEGFWKVRDRLVSLCSALTLESLRALGKELSLDPEKVDAALGGARQQEVDDASNLGEDWGVWGTPTLFINGRRVFGVDKLEAATPLIEEELARARALVDSGVPRERVYEALVAKGVPPPPPETKTVKSTFVEKFMA